MSIEAVNQFLTKANQDQKLKAELSKAIKAKNGEQATTELAAKHGYKFSQQELNSRIEEIKSIKAKQPANEELNEEELETVAGGGTPATIATVTAPVVGTAIREGTGIGDSDEGIDVKETAEDVISGIGDLF